MHKADLLEGNTCNRGNAGKVHQIDSWKAGMFYEEGLSKMDLYNVELRIRNNYIEIFKILVGLDKIDRELIFLLAGMSRNRRPHLSMKGSLITQR